MHERLAVLTEKDDVSAGHLSGGLEALTAMDPNFHGGDSAFKRTSLWLGANPGPHDILILPGASCPEDIEALVSLTPVTTRILLLERDLIRAAHLFTKVPLEKYVVEGRLTLAFGTCEDWIDHQLMTILYLPDSPAIGICGFSDPGQEATDVYNALLMKIRERVRFKVFNLATLVHLGPIWQFNALKNLPLIVSSPGIKDLDGIFAGRPALVVAAGPSLNDALKYITEFRNSFVLIAVGTALKPLRNAGIRPDIVVSVDASRKTGPQFETRCDDLFLACSTFAFPAILPGFRGIFCGYTSSDPVGEWISSIGPDKGAIMAGGTVTATALELAMGMGCSPIISVGLDLCMSKDGSTHASNSMYHGVKCPESHLVPVPGNYSDKVLTTTQFLTYVECISDYVTNIRRGREFINANTGGARIDGMKLILPEEIGRHAGGLFDAYGEISKRYSECLPRHEEDYIKEIEQAASDLGEVASAAMSAAMSCNRLIMLLRIPARGDSMEAEQLLGELNDIDGNILSKKLSSSLLNMSLRPAFFAMGDFNSGESRRRTDGLSSVQRSKVIYEQMAGAAKWTKDLIEASLQDIRSGCVSSRSAQYSNGNNKIAV